MRYGKWFIGLFTAMLILAAVIFGKSEYAWDGIIGITARIPSQEGVEELQCWDVRWDNEDKRGYFFLPAYADMAQIQLQTNVSNPVYLDGREITEGMTCEGFQTDVPYDLYYLHKGKEYHFSLTFLRSANVPALYIDTTSGAMEHIHEVKGNKEPGTMRLYGADGVLAYDGRLESVEGRGNSTWTYDKKPYNLTLSEEADLLGMGTAKRWVLLANATDSSQMRNKIAYDLARDIGLAYTPECQWVDLYLNGEYAGLYLLSERNEVHEQRIDIAGEGSFLVVKDWEWRFREEKAPYIMTESHTALQIHYSGLSEAQLQATLQSVENAILADNGVDPVTGRHWQDLIDLDSWVKKYLIEEVLGNVDASTLSQFYYREGTDGKLFAGPIWDMDLSLRESGSEWMKEQNQFYGNDPSSYGSSWVPALYQNEVFYIRLTEVYETEILPLLTRLREQGIAAYAEQVGPAVVMNNTRWSGRSLEKEITRIYAYLDKRISFLDRIWIDKEPIVVVEVCEDQETDRRIVLSAGDTLSDLPVYENTEEAVCLGWYYQDTDAPVDPQAPVWEDIAIELRYAETETEMTSEEDPIPVFGYGSALVFALFLIGVCFTGLKRSGYSRKREKNPIGE